MPNSLEDLIQQLQQQAGSRGSTFAGRLMPQGSNQSIGDVMSKPPIQELESAGAIDLNAIKSLGSLMAGGIPLLSKMKLPQDWNYSKDLNEMFLKRNAANTAVHDPGKAGLTQDSFIQSLLYELGGSASKLSNNPKHTVPLFQHAGMDRGGTLPRSQQLASMLQLAEKNGMLDNPEILQKIMDNRFRMLSGGRSNGLKVDQTMLDWYKTFLEGVKPDK